MSTIAERVTAAVDVAYLDAPYVRHAERTGLMMRVSPDCWQDTCWDCRVPGCICACHDEPPLRVIRPARRCRRCGYLLKSDSHRLTCGDRFHERIMRLADSIGRAA